MKHPKTVQEREAEVRHLEAQLADVGLPSEPLEPVRAMMTDFVRTGQGATTVVRIHPIELHVLLSNQRHIVSSMRITKSARS